MAITRRAVEPNVQEARSGNLQRSVSRIVLVMLVNLFVRKNICDSGKYAVESKAFRNQTFGNVRRSLPESRFGKCCGIAVEGSSAQIDAERNALLRERGM